MKAATMELKTGLPEPVRTALIWLCLLFLLAGVAFGAAATPWRAAGDLTGTALLEEGQNVQDIDPFALPSIGNAYLTGL